MCTYTDEDIEIYGDPIARTWQSNDNNNEDNCWLYDGWNSDLMRG